MIRVPPPRFLQGVSLVPGRIPDLDEFPWCLDVVRDLDLFFESSVTFFVGENGSGKSTVLEAIATLCGAPARGGGKHDTADQGGEETALSVTLRPSFKRRPHDVFFFRAETLFDFAELLERRERGDFAGDPYAAYGGRSLHTRSHGEAFLEVMQGRLRDGLYLFDEPEAALSPARQLAFLLVLAQQVVAGAQLIIATHSPILMTFPGARILSFDDRSIREVPLEDTEHFELTRSILSHPARFWARLLDDGDLGD